jgi:putative toxin-antitoxin system, toxin component
MKVKLGDICDIQSGGTPSRSKKSYWANGIIPWVKISDIRDKYIDVVDEYITEEGLQNSSAKIFPKGTLLYTIFATLGEAGILSMPACTNQAIVGIQPCTNDVDVAFLYYQMLSKRENICRMGRGVAQNNINLTILRNIDIELPSLVEQGRIVATLECLDNIVLLREQQLKKLDQLVKARFVELFGDPVLNPMGWDLRPLGELCTIVRGGSPRPIDEYLGGTIPWIKIGDASSGDNIYLHSTKEYIIQEGVKKSRLIKAGSLIFANCGVSLGFARIITFQGCIHDGWLALQDIDSSLDKVFLLESLNKVTDRFRAMAPIGTQPNLNTGIMKEYLQIVPPMDLQKTYLRFLNHIESLKSPIRASLSELQTLKKSLMQAYFA